MPDDRRCSRCRITYPLDADHFPSAPSRRSGFGHYCRGCHAAYMAELRLQPGYAARINRAKRRAYAAGGRAKVAAYLARPAVALHRKRTAGRRTEEQKAHHAAAERVRKLVFRGGVSKPTVCGACRRPPVEALEACFTSSSDPLKDLTWRCEACGAAWRKRRDQKRKKLLARLTCPRAEWEAIHAEHVARLARQEDPPSTADEAERSACLARFREIADRPVRYADLMLARALDGDDR